MAPSRFFSIYFRPGGQAPLAHQEGHCPFTSLGTCGPQLLPDWTNRAIPMPVPFKVTPINK